MSGGDELAGTLATRLALLRQAAGTDALGAPSAGWSELALVRAAVRPRARDPQDASDGLAALGRWRVTMRPRDVAEGDRMMGAGLDLMVLHVTRDPGTPDRIVADAEERR